MKAVLVLLLCIGGFYDLLWKKGNVILAGTNIPKNSSSRFQIVSGHTLQINSATMEDSGEYVCEISTRRPMRQMHVLDVKAAPRILRLSEKDPVILNEGSNISITCEAKGNPTPEITWQKRGGQEKARDGAVLTLVGVNRHHSGLYMCQATNSAGRPDEAAINIHIKHIPHIEINEPWIHGGEDSSSQISCAVYANPPANVNWLFNGNPVNSSALTFMNDDHNYFIRFEKVHKENFGIYTCFASNDMGDSEKDIELSGIPNPPVIVSSPEGQFETNYSLAWEVYCYSSLIDFRVEIKEHKNPEVSEEPEPWTEITVPADSSTTIRHTKSYEMQSLKPATNYYVRIYARNEYGWSKPSETFHFSTLGATIIEFATSSMNDQAEGVTEPMPSSGMGTLTEAAVQVENQSSSTCATTFVLWMTFLFLRL